MGEGRDCLPCEDSFRAEGKEDKHTGRGSLLPSTLYRLTTSDFNVQGIVSGFEIGYYFVMGVE